MESLDTLILIRGLERLLATGGGIVALILGALLFRWGVSGEASLVAQHDQTKLQLTNASPGILVALFGALLLGSSLFSPLRIDPAAAASVAQAAQSVRIAYSEDESPLRAFLEQAMATDPSLPPRDLQAQLRNIAREARQVYESRYPPAPRHNP